jgi:hypothetical protein
VPTPFDKIAIGVSGGTQNVAHYPVGTRAVQLPDSQLVSQFLDAFGRAERTVTCSCEVTKDATVSLGEGNGAGDGFGQGHGGTPGSGGRRGAGGRPAGEEV